MKKIFQKISFYSLILLFVFLPFSSWLVSMTGKASLSLIRDGLVLIIFLSVLFARNIKFNKITIIALLFIIYGILTYFWREASPLQWLRGFRFTFVPIILFLSVSNLKFDEKEKIFLLWSVLVGALVITIISIAEFIGLKIPLTTDMSAGNGLEATQYLQGHIRRLQSLLAGPNALGLYMLALTAYALGLFKKIRPKLIWMMSILGIIIFFTFSRSSLAGLVALLIVSSVIWFYKKIGHFKTIVVAVLFIVILAILSLTLYKSDKYNNYITHGTSSSLRYEQIIRVWNQKNEIGLLGRGSGTAGPSSQNRLDGGPNHWSENIYLEIFEELGLIGLILYLAIIVLLLRSSWKNYNTPEGQTAFLITLGFAVSGLFLNNYTGQVGIYLLWLANGLTLQKGNDEKNTN